MQPGGRSLTAGQLRRVRTPPPFPQALSCPLQRLPLLRMRQWSTATRQSWKISRRSPSLISWVSQSRLVLTPLTLLLHAVHEDITPMIKATRRGFENASCETYSIFADPLALTGDWAVPLYVVGMAYMLLGIAIVCDEYFVHAIQVSGALKSF